MITISNSPVKGSGIPNQLLGDRLHTMAIFRLSRVRTELFQLLVVPSLTPHPVETNSTNLDDPIAVSVNSSGTRYLVDDLTMRVRKVH
jgi:hypothetical protein